MCSIFICNIFNKYFSLKNYYNSLSIRYLHRHPLYPAYLIIRQLHVCLNYYDFNISLLLKYHKISIIPFLYSHADYKFTII
jgi:hypothetical protein